MLILRRKLFALTESGTIENSLIVNASKSESKRKTTGPNKTSSKFLDKSSKNVSNLTGDYTNTAYINDSGHTAELIRYKNNGGKKYTGKGQLKFDFYDDIPTVNNTTKNKGGNSGGKSKGSKKFIVSDVNQSLTSINKKNRLVDILEVRTKDGSVGEFLKLTKTNGAVFNPNKNPQLLISGLSKAEMAGYKKKLMKFNPSKKIKF